MKNFSKRVLAIDFDGVIVTDAYPHIGEEIEGASSSLQVLAKYFSIVIWTCREGLALEEAKSWLEKQKIPYDEINNNTHQNIKMYNNNSRKVYADLYIDDRSIGGFPGWRKTMAYIMSNFSEVSFYDHYL